MRHTLPLCLMTLVALQASALTNTATKSWLNRLWSSRAITVLDRRAGNVISEGNGSSYLWLPQDEYSGKTFFDDWDFFTGADPTRGHVNYVNESVAISKNLVYVQDDGKVIMKADDFTELDNGVFRDSVRISSKAQYNAGLFILDLNRAPWGCAVWPAFWTVGDNWPNNGEIDIIEGVHDNQHNQVAFHTADGCSLNPTTSVNFTGTISAPGGKNLTDCNGNINDNSGCSVTEWSRASYGPLFDAQGGGVFVMKWDETGISIWSFFRVAVPQDIVDGVPNPMNWGLPSATLDITRCDIPKFFVNHRVVFDITFCGDWAGNTYATSGCPGTCDERLMLASNFENATWSINSLKIFRKQILTGSIVNSSSGIITPPWIFSLGTLLFMLMSNAIFT